MESKSNKTSQIVFLIIGIIAFIAMSLIQTKATRDGNSSLNGVFAQIQVIISTLLVIMSRKKGFVAGVVLNLVSVLPVTLQFVKSGNLGMLPGIIIPFCTIITIGIIYLFSSRTRKMHAELTESYNKIVEANRVMKEKEKLTKHSLSTNHPLKLYPSLSGLVGFFVVYFYENFLISAIKNNFRSCRNSWRNFKPCVGRCFKCFEP